MTKFTWRLSRGNAFRMRSAYIDTPCLVAFPFP